MNFSGFKLILIPLNCITVTNNVYKFLLQCPQFKKYLKLQTNKNCQYLKFLKSNCPTALKSKIFNISTFLGSNCPDASNSIKYQKLVKQIVLLSAIQKKKKKKKRKNYKTNHTDASNFKNIKTSSPDTSNAKYIKNSQNKLHQLLRMFSCVRLSHF